MPQQFLVPQFIDVETKIIGPITTRQFILLMIAAMLDFVLYKLFFFNTFIMIAVPITLFFGVVAFAKINGMPFHLFALNVIQTTKRAKLRVWYKEKVLALPKEDKRELKEAFVPKIAPKTSRLSKMSLMVDTGGAYKGDEE